MASVTDPMIELAALHQANVKGIDAMVMSDPGQTSVIKRPWIDEPAGSQPFDFQNGIALPALPGDAVVLQFLVPMGWEGVIKKISNNVNFGGFVQFSGDIVWRILVDGRAVKNFDNIQNEKGSIQIPRDISPIRIYSGQLVQYVVNHVANVALNGQIICTLNGYLYPAKGIS